jgi:hypothetical protein
LIAGNIADICRRSLPMDLVATLPGLLVVAAFVAVAVAVADRRLGGEPFDAGALLQHSWEPGWPRGVQEEEPRRYRVELIDRRRPAPGDADPIPSAGSARRSGPVPAHPQRTG